MHARISYIHIQAHTDINVWAGRGTAVVRKNWEPLVLARAHTHTHTHTHRGGEEKLGAVGVRARIGHRQKSGHRVLDEALVELILEFLACIYRYVSRYISI